MHGRSMFKPLIEIWNLNIGLDLMNVALNSSLNKRLFETNATNRIFNRYPLETKFNKLPIRQYYNGSLDIRKIHINIQGHQSFLFFNELTDFFD